MVESKFACKKGLPKSPGAAPLDAPVDVEGLAPEAVEHVTELTTYLESLKDVGGEDRHVVKAVLDAAVRYADPPSLRSTAVKWLKRKKNVSEVEDRKFGDGLASAKAANTPEQIVKTPFYEHDYVPEMTPQTLVPSIATWHTPTGKIWSQASIDDLGQNADLILEHHSDEQPPEVVLPVWLYSASQIGRHVVWALWLVPPDAPSEGRWVCVPRETLDGALHGDSLKVNPAWFDDFNLPAGFVPSVVQASVRGDPYPAEVRGSAATADVSLFRAETACRAPTHRHFILARYACAARGDPKWSPLRDTVAWLPCPQADGSGFEVEPKALPPSGVLEYLHSRGCEEAQEWPAKSAGWRAEFLLGEYVQWMIKICFAEPDQQQYNAMLHNVVKDLFHVLCGTRTGEEIRGSCEWLAEEAQKHGAPAFSAEDVAKDLESRRGVLNPATSVAALGGETEPPPGMLAHCLELQRLDWGGATFAVGLSGSHPAVAVNGVSHRVYRVNHTYDDQIFWHLNYAMRSAQFGTLPHLTISEGDGAGKYFAQEPATCEWNDDWDGQEDDASVADPRVLFVDSGTQNVALWDGVTWTYQKSGEPSVPLVTGSVWLTLGSWLLRQATGFIFYLDRALETLATLPSCMAPPGLMTYRGLKGVTLPTSVYDMGKIALWSAYSSTSSDRGVASAFAKGKDVKAAVFSLQGRSCVCVAKWSRFGREREWLYPPNSTFQVTSTLDEEQAKILGLHSLQLFSMQEVSEVEGLLIYLQDLVNLVVKTVEGSLMPRHVEQIFNVMQSLKEGGLTRALKACCALNEPMVRTQEGAEVTNMLIKIGADTQAFTDLALSSAAGPDPETFVLLVRCGAAFEGAVGAVGWMETYEERGRSEVGGVGLASLEELICRAGIEAEEQTEILAGHAGLKVQLEGAFGRIPCVRVSQCTGAHMHFNGVYAMAPALRLRPAVLCSVASLRATVEAVDRTRTWGCFLESVPPGMNPWGLKAGMRVLAVAVGESDRYPISGPQSLEDALGAAAERCPGDAVVVVEVEEKVVFRQVNPQRFMSYAEIRLGGDGVWRITDVALENMESEKQAGWEDWVPVGKYKTVVHDRTASPYRWLLGWWEQKDEHRHRWELGELRPHAPAVSGGVLADGVCVNEGLALPAWGSDLSQRSDAVVPSFADSSLIEAAWALLPRDSLNASEPVHRLFEQTKLLPTGEYYVQVRGGSLYLVDKEHMCERTLTRRKKQVAAPYVSAENDVAKLQTDGLPVDGNYVPAPPENARKLTRGFTNSNEPGKKRAQKEGVSDGATPALTWATVCRGRVGGLRVGRTSERYPRHGPMVAEGALFPVKGGKVRARNRRGGMAEEAWVYGVLQENETTLVLVEGKAKPEAFDEVERFEYDWWRVAKGDGKCAIAESRCTKEFLEAVLASSERWGNVLANNDTHMAQMQAYLKANEARVEARTAYALRSNLMQLGLGSAQEEEEGGSAQVGVSSAMRMRQMEAHVADILKQEDVSAKAVQLLDPKRWLEDDRYTMPLGDTKLAPGVPRKVREVSATETARSGTEMGNEPGLITVHVGQAGIQVGGQLWDLYAREHGIDGGGGDVNPLLFGENKQGYAARALFVDTDSCTISRLRCAKRSMFTEVNFIQGNECASDLFSRGQDAKKLLGRDIESNLASLLEKIDTFAGFHFVHGMGGTGSGLMTEIAHMLEDEAGKAHRHNFAILPGATATPTQIYNSVLALSNLVDRETLTTVFDNTYMPRMHFFSQRFDGGIRTHHAHRPVLPPHEHCPRRFQGRESIDCTGMSTGVRATQADRLHWV